MRKTLFPLIFLAAVFFLIRIPNLTLQPVFCDEAIYIHWAQKILGNFQRNAFIPLTDGKTPLFMWTAAPFLAIFNDPLFAGRMVSVLSGFATMLGGVFLGKKFFDEKTGFLAGLFLAILPFTVFFDKMALTDSMLAAFSLWSLILALLIVQKIEAKRIILLGLVLGLGTWVKTPGIFSFLTLPIVLVAVDFKKEKLSGALKVLLAFLGSAAVGYSIYNLLRFSQHFSQLTSRDSDYYFPLSRLLESPFNPLMGHLKDLADWLPRLVTPPILVLIGVALVLIFLNKDRKSLAIFLWGLLPLVAMSLLLKTFTARYILFCAIPLVFLGAVAARKLFDHSFIKKKPALAWLLIFSLLLPALSFDLKLMTNLAAAPLPAESRQGYFENWLAGYGAKEISDFLKSTQYEHEKVLLVTEGAFGVLPDGIQIYLGKNKNIKVWTSGSQLSEDVYAEARVTPTFFAVNKSHQAFNRNLELIKDYPKLKSEDGTYDSLLLYRVKPD